MTKDMRIGTVLYFDAGDGPAFETESCAHLMGTIASSEVACLHLSR